MTPGVMNDPYIVIPSKARNLFCHFALNPGYQETVDKILRCAQNDNRRVPVIDVILSNAKDLL